jgi:hypothetical protein
MAVTERFSYFAFLAVVFTGLVVMTTALAVTWIFLLRRNRQARRTRQPPVRRADDQPRGSAPSTLP